MGRKMQTPGAVRRLRPERVRNNGWRRLARLVIASSIGALGIAHAAEPPVLKPRTGPWDAGGGFVFDKDGKKNTKVRRSLSGIACAQIAGSTRRCLVVFDEGVEARYVVMNDGSYTLEAERVVLRQSGGELDAEGAASDARYYYVTGSHSAKRGNCKSNPDSRRVIRFAIDPATGRALRSPPGSPTGSLADYKDTDALWGIMASVPQLKAHVGEKKCLGTEPPEDAPHLKGQRGVNIEGLAVQGGRLFFGFRGPAQNGEALILSLDAKALFEGGPAREKLARLTLGQGRGIRDLHAVKDGILVLAGPDDDKANADRPWIIALWDGKGDDKKSVEPKLLAQLDLRDVKLRGCDKELKPEALAVLQESPVSYRVVILSDGMCDGGPLAFEVPR